MNNNTLPETKRMIKDFSLKSDIFNPKSETVTGFKTRAEAENFAIEMSLPHAKIIPVFA